MKATHVILTLLCITCLQVPHYGQDKGAQTSCIPVKSVDEKSLAFGHGEKMSFILDYNWGTVTSDVAYATVSIDSLTYDTYL